MALDRRRFLAVGGGAAAMAATGLGTAWAASTTDRKAAHDAIPQPSLRGFTSGSVVANGIRQHYVAGGTGEPLVLLHGWPQTWWMWRKVMPALAEHFRVIAVDLRGMGGTAKPAGGYDKKNMAKDIHELIRALGYRSVHLAGHDIGSMVAYSFAANHPAAARKVALLDVLHPDDSYYEFRMLPRPGQSSASPWWFAFNQVRQLPEELIAGQGREVVDWVFDYLLVDRGAIDDRSRAVFGRNYSYPAAIRGGNSWYQAFGQDIADLKTYRPVGTPLLGLAHPGYFPLMRATLPKQGTDVRVAEIAGTGHYLVEEQPSEVVRHFLDFFGRRR
ncbi:alpha/beta fold hydrolase [Nonomuraea sp. NPDC049714]|uniref:alpha/beta fold hydrolase n=1 Tax=Nonomuraea sp. NPDC049714 TaxID=3364357 RepID=UPI0037B7F90B